MLWVGEAAGIGTVGCGGNIAGVAALDVIVASRVTPTLFTSAQAFMNIFPSNCLCWSLSIKQDDLCRISRAYGFYHCLVAHFGN